MPILPGRPRSYWVITDAHGGKTRGDGMAIGRVAVANEMVTGEGFGDLAGDPLRRWIGGYAERYQPPPLVVGSKN
jgi:hypothetical protein